MKVFRAETLHDAAYQELLCLLRDGGIIAFPTDTTYGLGVDPFNTAAVDRIFQTKGRAETKPILLVVDSIEMADSVSHPLPVFHEVVEKFWPGPLTLVVRKACQVPDVATAGGPTVALRMPAHPVALALLKTADMPLAAPSANRSARLSPTLAQHVLRDLDGRIAMILDGGATAGGLESTVLDLTSPTPRLLRPGLVSPAEIESVVGPISRAAGSDGGPARSPGMQEKHYAPRTPLECVHDGAGRVKELVGQGLKVAWVTFRKGEAGELTRILPNDPRQYATMLYATLHELDEAGADRIVVDLPPDREEWQAVRDRLFRAGAKADNSFSGA